MKNENRKWLTLLIVPLIVVGCMRYQSDTVYTRYTIGQIVEVDDAGNRHILDVGYREFGRGAGDDGQFGTTDDDIASYNKVIYNPAGQVLYQATFAGAGPDGKIFTDDDDMNSESFRRVVYESSERYVWMGYNGSVDIADIITRETGQIQVESTGWGTVNLNVITASIVPTKYSGFPVSYSGLSPTPYPTTYTSNSVVPTTIPPVVGSGGETVAYLEKTKTTDGYLWAYYAGPGKDLTWFSGSEDVGAYWKVIEAGLDQTIYAYNGPGIDNKWFTGDDNIQYVTYLQRDNRGHITFERNTVNIGDDKTYDTSDDVFTTTLRGYDEDDRILYEKIIVDLGDDNTISTDDDLLQQINEWRYFRDGEKVTTLKTQRFVPPNPFLPPVPRDVSSLPPQGYLESGLQVAWGALLVEDESISEFGRTPVRYASFNRRNSASIYDFNGWVYAISQQGDVTTIDTVSISYACTPEDFTITDNCISGGSQSMASAYPLPSVSIKRIADGTYSYDSDIYSVGGTRIFINRKK